LWPCRQPRKKEMHTRTLDKSLLRLHITEKELAHLFPFLSWCKRQGARPSWFLLGNVRKVIDSIAAAWPSLDPRTAMYATPTRLFPSILMSKNAMYFFCNYLHFAASFHLSLHCCQWIRWFPFLPLEWKSFLRVSLWLQCECKVNGAINARNWDDLCYCVSFRRWGSILGDTRYVPKHTNHQI
jgi:hypothetical protein